MSTHTTSLSGKLHIIPFSGAPLAKRIDPIYTQLLEGVENDPRNILVLKRFPDRVPEFTTKLRNATGLDARPNVKSIARHAATVLDEGRPHLSRLTYEQRIEFLATVLAGHNWPQYFESASQHDSFGRDVGQLLLDATWQGGFETPSIPSDHYDELLAELSRVNSTFHEKLSERDLIEQADTIPSAIEVLDDETFRAHIQQEFDVVLAVEFEEYSDVERQYLRKLADGVDLVCIGEQYASIDRVQKEPGTVRGLSDDMEIVDHTDASQPDAPDIGTINEEPVGEPFGEYLATGELTRADTTDAVARVIIGNTLDEQVREVANEIEYLRQSRDWEYNDFAVLLQSVGDPMPRIRRVLRHAGIPTSSAGVNGLEQDLAVREIHALAQYSKDQDQTSLSLLQSRVSDANHDLIQECIEPSSIEESLKQWIVTTNLKERIASSRTDIDAREQFQNIDRLLSMAEFVDGQDFLSREWHQFQTMLERAITYDAPYAHTAEVNVPEGGVTVGDIALAKDNSQKAVFLLNVVDAEYPGNESLSSIFPTAWIKKMEGYPAVTNPSESTVTSTFPTVEELNDEPFDEYHNACARRKLGVGARAAEEELYFCLYESANGAVSKPRHRSRYLHEIMNHPDLSVTEIEGAGEDRDIYTLGCASTEVLSQPWTELERVQANAAQGGDITLEDHIETLAEVAAVIEESENITTRFKTAVQTQFNLARGAIRPSETSSREEES